MGVQTASTVAGGSQTILGGLVGSWEPAQSMSSVSTTRSLDDRGIPSVPARALDSRGRQLDDLSNAADPRHREGLRAFAPLVGFADESVDLVDWGVAAQITFTMGSVPRTPQLLTPRSRGVPR